MQTPAEKHLVKLLMNIQKKNKISEPSYVLNIGAGKSLSIENQLQENGCNYRYDRIDIDDCKVEHQYVNECWSCSAESMLHVRSSKYHAAFANYVIEHIPDLNKASREIYRILKPSGLFVASLSNPTSPEMILAKITPLWFHKKIRGAEAWETYYAYKNISDLKDIFESNGFRIYELAYYSFIEGYLHKFFLVGAVAKIYDKIISMLNIKRMMGNVCIAFEKLP